jgi:hypothetical protein
MGDGGSSLLAVLEGGVVCAIGIALACVMTLAYLAAMSPVLKNQRYRRDQTPS